MTPLIERLEALGLQCEHRIGQLANALSAEVVGRQELADVKSELAYREAEIALDERIDGRNAETRQAQLRQFLAEDEAALAIRRRLREAERDYGLTIAQIEVWRERIHASRALMTALAGGGR